MDKDQNAAKGHQMSMETKKKPLGAGWCFNVVKFNGEAEKKDDKGRRDELLHLLEKPTAWQRPALVPVWLNLFLDWIVN